MRDVTLINLTDHPVNLHTDLGKPGMHKILVIKPSGLVIRAKQKTEVLEKVTHDGQEISITSTNYLPIENLPPPQPDTLYIVSMVVALKARGTRDDLVICNGLVRDKKGITIGCKSLGKL